MFKKDVVVKIENGLHARPVSEFIQRASKFNSEIKIKMGDKIYNAKSILALISAGIRYDSEVTISADGADEKEAVEELAKFIEAYDE